MDIGEAFFYTVVIILLVRIIYESVTKKDSFVRYFSRGSHMRELNEKLEKKDPEK